MTKRRLPETDQCNICTLPEADQWVRLAGKKSFIPPHSLEAVRRNMQPLFGVNTAMFPDAEVEDDQAIAGLHRAIKKPRDLKPNLMRAEAIIDFRRSYVTGAISEAFPSHRISIDTKVQLTHSFAIETDQGRYIPFVDLRKSGSLSARGRDFLFAMNFHLIIDAMSDFEDFGLVILNYWEESALNKGFTPYFFDGKPKYSYDQLADMISRTNEIWNEILEGRRRGDNDSGSAGPLFA